MRYKIRKAQEKDIETLSTMFHDAVSEINSKNYTQEQIKVWQNRATPQRWLKLWVRITAKPFFEKMGFYAVKKQSVYIEGVELINYVMNKTLNIGYLNCKYTYNNSDFN